MMLKCYMVLHGVPCITHIHRETHTVARRIFIWHMLHRVQVTFEVIRFDSVTASLLIEDWISRETTMHSVITVLEHRIQ